MSKQQVGGNAMYVTSSNRKLPVLRLPVIIAAILLMTGCSNSRDTEKQPVTESFSTNGMVELSYIDADVFDSTIRELLDQDAEMIRISFVGEVSINALPPRLRTWIDESAEQGATVELVDREDAETDRGVDLLMAKSVYESYQQYRSFQKNREIKRLYELAGNYRFEIVYDTETGALDRIDMTRRN